MRAAMGVLAVLAVIGGLLQVPALDDALHKFLEPTFRDSALYARLSPSNGAAWFGLLVGTALGLAGIFVAYTLYVRSPERPAVIRARFAALHRFFVNKWYFDEAFDVLFVRPGAWGGRFARNTFERIFVQGALVGGASTGIRALSAAVRRVQSGYLRYYAALLLVGLTGLGAYFLISA
jgi:NADH-quinone oxidoreductase subunit L